MCPIAIYNLQLQNQDAREASAYSFCAKQNSKKAPSEEPQRAVTPNCRAIALFSKRMANHKHLQQLYTGASATTLSLPSATWCRAAQEKEWSFSISSQILSGGQGPLCCQPKRSQEEICPTVVLSWPHGTLQRACSWKAFHGGVQTHQDSNSQLCTETGDHTGLLVALFAFGKQSIMLALSQTGFWGIALIYRNLSWFIVCCSLCFSRRAPSLRSSSEGMVSTDSSLFSTSCWLAL